MATIGAKVSEIARGIHQIFLPLPMRPSIVNVYLVDCSGDWALIDTGTNGQESLSALEGALGQLGITFDRLGAIIMTHHHIDHCGASAELQRLSGARLYIHALELDRITRTIAFAGSAGPTAQAREFFLRHGFPVDRYGAQALRPTWLDPRLYQPSVRPDHLMADGDIIPVGKRRFEVIWTPGHAPGHCVLYLSEEKVMIVGDHLLPKITPHVGLYPGSVANPLGDFIASLEKVQQFDVALVAPAHGGMFHDHRHRARQLIEHHRYREAEMLDLIRKRPMNAYEVAQQIFGSQERPTFHILAATFETLAHLEYARLEGRARAYERDGQVVYQCS